MSEHLSNHSVHIALVLLLFCACSCSSDDVTGSGNDDTVSSHSATTTETDHVGGETTQTTDADPSTSSTDTDVVLDTTESRAEETPVEHAQPQAFTVTFDEIEYIHRFSDGGLHEFTPEGQEDLSKWTDMLSINVYPDISGAEDLASIANQVLTLYTSNGGELVRTDSVPRTETTPAEHLVAVTFRTPDANESVLARFLLIDDACVALIHSHRTYGNGADDELSAWVEGEGSGLDDELMEWDEYPTPEELESIEQ